MFAAVPPLDSPSTTVVDATTIERPPQIKANGERGPTTITTVPKAMPTPTTLIGKVYVSAASIKAMA